MTYYWSSNWARIVAQSPVGWKVSRVIADNALHRARKEREGASSLDLPGGRSHVRRLKAEVKPIAQS